MVNMGLKIQGLEELKRQIHEKKMELERQLDTRLLQLCEEAVAHAKLQKGYKDHTANLKNTISFALYKDGELVRNYIGINNELPKDLQDKKVLGDFVESRLEDYCRKDGVVVPVGYSLVIVAPMDYAQFVEDKGYNVLHLTKYYLEDGLKRELEEAFNAVF